MISVRKNVLRLGILFSAACLLISAGCAGVQKPGAVSGKILTKEGQALAGGQVLFFNAGTGPPPSPDEYERAPDIIGDLEGDGSFIMELPPGTYYMRAVKRASGERFGPPRAGDYVFRNVDDKGNPKSYRVEPGRFLSVGTLAGAYRLETGHAEGRETVTAVKGIITDSVGFPVRDAVVVAFVSDSMSGKPLFVSDATGPDGSYILRVTPGTYYLRVRSFAATGPPVPGQIVGFYGEGRPEALTVNEAEVLEGINFSVIQFTGRGPFPGVAPGK